MAGRFIWVEERLGSIPNSPIYYKRQTNNSILERDKLIL